MVDRARAAERRRCGGLRARPHVSGDRTRAQAKESAQAMTAARAQKGALTGNDSGMSEPQVGSHRFRVQQLEECYALPKHWLNPLTLEQ